MHKVMEAGGLDFDSGRRIADIGKVPPSLALAKKASVWGGWC
jgi:hypothetical protein